MRVAIPLRVLVAAVAVGVLLVSSCSSQQTGTGPASTGPAGTGPASTAAPTTGTTGPSTGPTPAADDLPAHLQVARQGPPRIVDDQGRQVLLRGVNLNSLGEYHQADPELAPTIPLSGDDWDEMASLGFSAVRLIVSWSRLEPEPGVLDPGYVADIHAALDEAEARGIAVILDMHQDAWSATLATPDGYTCPEGLEPAIGWDGAPAWATLSDGAETCRNPGSRESALAVRTAFQSFYDDRDGIRTALAQTWGRLATEVADRPVVAGYDLFNEPNGVEDLAVQQPKYTAFLDDTIAAIRAGEAANPDGFAHLLFVEPIVLWPLPSSSPAPGFTEDPDVVFAPHNYWEAISQGLFTIEEGFDLDQRGADALGVPFWVGEYGWWDTGEETLARLRRYAAAEDAARVGGAWWQWRQACGDPHSVGHPGGDPGDQIHLNTMRCPSGEDAGVTGAFATVLSRAYPCAAPGYLTELSSDPDARTLTLTGRAEDATGGAPLVVWVPAGGAGEPGAGEPGIGGTGIGAVELREVSGGWLVEVEVGCEYHLEIDGTTSRSGPVDPC